MLVSDLSRLMNRIGFGDRYTEPTRGGDASRTSAPLDKGWTERRVPNRLKGAEFQEIRDERRANGLEVPSAVGRRRHGIMTQAIGDGMWELNPRAPEDQKGLLELPM